MGTVPSGGTSAVELVSITPNAEAVIGYCARVSNPSATPDDDASKLLSYCAKHGHWSVFEMAHMTVAIECSRAISAQILRHKSFSFQEFSQRYAAAQEAYVYPARRQDVKNRQSSIDDMSEEDREWFTQAQETTVERALWRYNEALRRGIAKEQARFLLPMSTKTKLYMCGSVRSWIHYLQLRCGNGTQLEHQEVALAIRDIFCRELPTLATTIQPI